MKNVLEECSISRGQAVQTEGFGTGQVDRRKHHGVLRVSTFGVLQAYGTKPAGHYRVSTLAVSLPTRCCLSSAGADAKSVVVLAMPVDMP